MATHLEAGDTPPSFTCPTMKNPEFIFDSAAGRYVVMAFFGSVAKPLVRERMREARKRTDLFDDEKFSLFGVTTDPRDQSEPRIAELYPGHRVFLDFNKEVSRLYGVIGDNPETGAETYSPTWFVFDPGLRIMKVLPFRENGSDYNELIAYLEKLPQPPSSSNGYGVEAPILMLPQVFEPELCKYLINMYKEHGGEESGFMVEKGGKTVGSYDYSFKRRQDYTITDRDIIKTVCNRIMRRVVPQIQKAHMFEATRIERFIVAHYGAKDGGHFRAHRDNTTTATAHRRFAVSINLNDDFEGGGVGFPEYGSRYYAPPAGGAVVFSCALLHQVTPVTSGDRYAFLPFLYDDVAKEIREATKDKLVPATKEGLAEAEARLAAQKQQQQ